MDYRKQPVKAVVSYPTRSLMSTYQNTTGRPLMVIVTLRIYIPDATSYSYAQGRCASSTPPATVVCDAGKATMGTAVGYLRGILVFIVPNNYYYRVYYYLAGNGTIDKIYWSEVEL